MDHYLLGIIRDTAGFIEANILEELDLESVASHVNVSKFHLLRIWKGATSTGIIEYVRKRRLALSLRELLGGKLPIECIAAKYFFEYERSFVRAFKQEYSVTPAAYRKKPRSVSITDAFNWELLGCVDKSIVYPLDIVVCPGFMIGGNEHLFTRREDLEGQLALKYGVEFFYRHRPLIVNPVDKYIYYGRSAAKDGFDERINYFCSVQIDENSILPGYMKAMSIDTYKYGVFKYMGLHSPDELTTDRLENLWGYIVNNWQPTVDFNRDTDFYFLRVDYSKTSREYCECELFIPITRLSPDD